MMITNSISSTPRSLTRFNIGGSNSPLRRRSLIHLKNIQDLEINDDDAERSSLVASERIESISSLPPSSPGRHSMSASPQKEHFQGCLKLFAENKITKDNAWNLQLIDFMTSMLRRHDARMDNLQTASTVVDASAKIYSFRVDAVHYDVLKMAGGLTKATQSKRGKKDDDTADQEETPAEGENSAPKKKKKRSKGAVATNPEIFNGEFDANDCIDPFFERLAATAGDVTSSNRAFNATLPIHDETLALILRTDIPFLETPNDNNDENKLDLNERITLSLKLLPAFNISDKICEPFADFSLSNWDPDTELSENKLANWMEEDRLNLSQQALAFDVNAEVEPVLDDDAHNVFYEDELPAGVDSEEEADVAVAACVARLPGAGLARLTDLRPSELHHARLEYSYCAPALAWAGPAHWKLKNNRASKLSEGTAQTTGRLTVENRKVKPKKNLDMLGEGLAMDWRQPGPDFDIVPSAKIMISRKTLATGHSWNEHNFKTPVDRGLDESFFRKLYLRSNVMMTLDREEKEEDRLIVETQYQYDNENDQSYCPDREVEYENDLNGTAYDLHEQIRQDNEDIGDMLEPPTKVAKIFIPYAMRAKKVDMKQLKHCTWKMLTENSNDGEKEDVSETTFFSVYSRLPNKLSTNMRESLSIPLALLSVLHLANEKGLVLEKKDDLNDIGIVGLIKNYQ